MFDIFRLHTVMDSDKVLVMDAGSAVEFNHPHILLQNTESIFCGLVKETGKTMADHLIEIAGKVRTLDFLNRVYLIPSHLF